MSIEAYEGDAANERPWLNWEPLDRIGALDDAHLAPFVEEMRKEGILPDESATMSPGDAFSKYRARIESAAQSGERVASDIGDWAVMATVELNRQVSVNGAHAPGPDHYDAPEEVLDAIAQAIGKTDRHGLWSDEELADLLS
jgi:hypothetical protein